MTASAAVGKLARQQMTDGCEHKATSWVSQLGMYTGKNRQLMLMEEAR